MLKHSERDENKGGTDNRTCLGYQKANMSKFGIIQDSQIEKNEVRFSNAVLVSTCKAWNPNKKFCKGAKEMDNRMIQVLFTLSHAMEERDLLEWEQIQPFFQWMIKIVSKGHHGNFSIHIDLYFHFPLLYIKSSTSSEYWS